MDEYNSDNGAVGDNSDDGMVDGAQQRYYSDDDTAPVPKINFVPCVQWVKRGVSKANPDKVELTEEELQAIINETKTEIDDAEEEEKHVKSASGADGDKNVDDEFDFAHYDDDNGKPFSVLNIGNIVTNPSTSKDSYVTLNTDDDSEKEDDIIRPEDNLILVGHVEGDASILEVYVYNEEEGSLYVHHDMMLPSLPLCIEWLGYEPLSKGTSGNLCAIGSMSPVIELWDIDIVDCLEATCKLGRKPKKKKGVKRVGHRDAVLDLAWNTIFPHILASGSVDQTVLLWDLDNGSPASKFTSFNEKVQSLKWHPFESQTLLTGCCDGVARVFDCRTENSFKQWEVGGEVERVLWNQFDPFNFLASTSAGKVFYIDCRSDTPVWQLAAHSSAVTGLSMSTHCPGLLVTASTDGSTKMWDIGGKSGNKIPVFVNEKHIGLGALHCLESCPDSPFVFCAGGDYKSNNFKVWNVMYENRAAQERFSGHELVRIGTAVLDSSTKQSIVKPMDSTCEASEAMQSLSLGTQGHKKTKLKSLVKNKKKIKGCKKL